MAAPAASVALSLGDQLQVARLHMASPVLRHGEAVAAETGDRVIGEAALMDRHVVARAAIEAHLRAVLEPETLDVPVIGRMGQDAIRHLVERFFNKIRFFRRIANRYDKLGSTYLAMVNLAAISIWLRFNESAA